MAQEGEDMLDRYLIVIDQTSEDDVGRVVVVPIVVHCKDDEDAETMAAAILHVMEIEAEVDITNLDEGVRAAEADDEIGAAYQGIGGSG